MPDTNVFPFAASGKSAIVAVPPLSKSNDLTKVKLAGSSLLVIEHIRALPSSRVIAEPLNNPLLLTGTIEPS